MAKKKPAKRKPAGGIKTNSRRKPGTSAPSTRRAPPKVAKKTSASKVQTPAFLDKDPCPNSFEQKKDQTMLFETTGFDPSCVIDKCHLAGAGIFTIKSYKLNIVSGSGQNISVTFEFTYPPPGRSASRSATTPVSSRPRNGDLTITVESGGYPITKKYTRVAYPPIDDPKKPSRRR